MTALLASAGAAFAIRLWEADLKSPFSYTDDGLLMLSLAKTVLGEGWWFTTSSLGFPFGQELYDYPFAAGNTLHILGLAGLGVLLGDPVLVINVFFLLSFPLIAVVAFLVFRRLGISIVVSVFAGSVFAILPYHFARNVDHLFLSSYYTIPIAGYLIVKVFSGRPLFELSGGRRKQALQIAAVVALCVAIGSTATYYAVFTVLLLLVGGVISAVVHPRLGTLPGAAVASALILGTLLVAFSPVLVHRMRDGANPAVAARGADETERLSLRISELVLPVGHHRLGPLADLRDRYEEATPLPTESNQALGVVACVGLLTLLGVAAAAAVGRRWSAGPMSELPPIAAATVVAILLATTGGFSTVASYLGVTQLRAWNRMSILIAFFCVLAVALLLDAARARIARGLLGRVAFGALLAVLGVVALLDQTNDSFVPQYTSLQGPIRERSHIRSSDRAAARSRRRRLPASVRVVSGGAEPPRWHERVRARSLPTCTPRTCRGASVRCAADPKTGRARSSRSRWRRRCSPSWRRGSMASTSTASGTTTPARRCSASSRRWLDPSSTAQTSGARS